MACPLRTGRGTRCVHLARRVGGGGGRLGPPPSERRLGSAQGPHGGTAACTPRQMRGTRSCHRRRRMCPQHPPTPPPTRSRRRTCTTWTGRGRVRGHGEGLGSGPEPGRLQGGAWTACPRTSGCMHSSARQPRSRCRPQPTHEPPVRSFMCAGRAEDERGEPVHHDRVELVLHRRRALLALLAILAVDLCRPHPRSGQGAGPGWGAGGAGEGHWGSRRDTDEDQGAGGTTRAPTPTAPPGGQWPLCATTRRTRRPGVGGQGCVGPRQRGRLALMGRIAV